MTDEQDKVIESLTKDLGFRLSGHQIVYYRFQPDEDGKLQWGVFAAKPATTGETALWDQLVVARRALAGTTESLSRVTAERDKLLSGKAIGARPGPTHGEAAEPKRG